MRKVLRRRAIALVMALCMMISMISTDMLGMTMQVQAESGTSTTWDFAQLAETIDGTDIDYNGLKVTGKLRPNGDSAQLFTTTVISVPVTGNCDITVVGHSEAYGKYKINGVEATTVTTTVAHTYTGTDGAVEYVTVEGVNDSNSYVKTITVTYLADDTSATEAPATEAPATEAPATEAPATEAPATEAPATEAPATEAPATEAPATEAPATEAPTEAPVEKNYLVLDGEEVNYDFRLSTFGAYGKGAAATWTHADGILSVDGEISYNGGQHGATVSTGTTFNINAPAGRAVITLGVCEYGSASATLYADGEAVSKTVSIAHGTEDNTEFEFKYTSDKAVTLSLVISGGGFLHYINAKSETPPATYVLSGSLEGLSAEELAALTAIKFTATAVSDYEVPAATIDTTNGTYSIELANGIPYTATAIGTGNKVITTTVPAYSVDTTLNLVFEEAAVYKVTMNKSADPDLSDLSCQFVYTHEDGNVYTFTDMNAISLRDGNYTFAVTGDIDKVAYKINEGSTLTVAGSAVTHLVKFEEVTAWVFGGTGYSKAIQSGTGYYQGLYIDATTGKLQGRGSDAQFNTGAIINVPVKGKCTIAVTASSGPQYALYTINGVQASVEDMTTVVDYTGEAGYVQIVATGTAYLTGIAVTYPATEEGFVAQPVMPFVPEDDTDANTDHDTDDIPRASVKDTLTVQPDGQKLILSQSGGNASGKYNSISKLGYYVFPMTEDNNKLEFDITITAAGTSNGDGAFMGLFNNSYMYTLGIRKGINPRAIYSKGNETSGSDFAGAGGINNTLAIGEPLHVTITKAADGKPTITYEMINTGEEYKVSTSTLACEETGYYYGLIVSDATVVISNMLYTAADGTVLYNQNSCYYPKGTAPVATSVSAVAAETREYIDISWEGSVTEDDGTYVVEMQLDGGEWITLATDITTLSYRYTLPEGGGGHYLFRVCGQLGNPDLGGSRNDYVTMTEPVSVLAALGKPEVAITAESAQINLSWESIDNAEEYEVYRYSYDETEAGIKLVATVTTTSYTDNDVEPEVPYYYQVKAVADSNESPLSDTVWAVATSGHTGEYVYEEEATEIFITEKSYDTVFTSDAVLAGNVYGNGTLELEVNGQILVTQADMVARDRFRISAPLNEGRNDVNLLFTDKDGKVTRKTFNFVYLTNYDMVVDSSFEGTDGDANADGIPTYKTVQAAVDAVPADNTDSKVILVMAGEYEERLDVSNPYITLVGQDRENTLIHCYPADILGDSKAEAGGDMDKRCATIIRNTAVGFTAENITFANDYVYGTADGKSNKSADAIRVEADKSSFVNVKFVGVQDTLYMHAGKQYYYKCVIEGLVDFIYSGDDARAFFNDCDIVFVYESTKKSGYVAAPKTAESATYGLTFYNCRILSEEGCAGNGYLLARPWGADAYITWIDCYMGKVINALAPYSDMGGPHAEARFYEFGTYGPGFAINVDRRQISPTKAAEMISASYLGWDPEAVVTAMSVDHYVGDVTTTGGDQVDENERVDDTYLWIDGNDTGLKMYDMEGYTEAYGVTGGGLLKETSENYYVVDAAEEFLDALVAVKGSGKNSVIELTADINLGCNEIDDYDSYSSIIAAHKYQPLTHPTLIESGMSQLNMDGFYNLTIFSSNGSSIKHVVITLKNSGNIIIRNIKFDELWEWDEATEGDYDRNDWDYMTIDSGCNGIWVDHCTFYKAYDGIVDVKNPNPISNVTVSWCEFLPGSEDNVFFNAMMDEIVANPDTYPTYQHLLEAGMSADQIYMYAYAQKKTHLLGQGDEATNAAGIRMTLANNYYKNSMDRMPRLRYGYAHVYNCIMDAQDLLNVRLSIKDELLAEKIVSNGAASTCGGQMLLENCYINGIMKALNSGNGNSPAGYINAVNSLYYMNGVETELKPENNGTADDVVLITDADSFVNGLPYSGYVLYDAEDLDGIVKYYAGAGKLQLTNLQWEKTSYNAEWKDPVIGGGENPTPTEAPTSAPTAAPTEAPTAAPTEAPTATPAPTKSPDDIARENVTAFVERMYTVALGRDADPSGVQFWVDNLYSYVDDGASISKGFILGPEFIGYNYSNSEFIEILYHTYFNRELDEAGEAFWSSALENGATREQVLAGFVNSPEFFSLCRGYGISRGYLNENGTAVNPGIYRFAERLYSTILERQGDEDGIESWTVAIAGGGCTPEAAAESFFWSGEYLAKGTSDEAFVKALYRTFMDREADPFGIEAWKAALDGGVDRKTVMNSFAACDEFQQIKAQYGL